MRILVLSDLHLEFGTDYRVPADVDYDVVVLAGDIDCPCKRAVDWAADPMTFEGRPVLIVPGNHEFYRTEMTTQLLAMRQAAVDTNVRVLSRDSIVIDDVRFLGTTLWTDFSLPVGNDAAPSDFHAETDIARALAEANRCLNDFRLIQLADPSIPRHRTQDIKRRLLTAEDTLAIHHVDRDWLRRALELGHAGPTVVVTHHAPHPRSVAAQFRNDWLTPAFVSGLPSEFFEGSPMWVAGRQVRTGGPVLWVHGHTHTAFEYQVGGCRVVSNPRGYRPRQGVWENPQFDPGCVVEVDHG